MRNYRKTGKIYTTWLEAIVYIHYHHKIDTNGQMVDQRNKIKQIVDLSLKKTWKQR